MENQKFTEGVWHIFLDTIQTRNGGKIAEVCTENDICKNNWEANAKLIAAAPELLNACIESLSALKSGYIEQRAKAFELILAAIKKATE